MQNKSSACRRSLRLGALVAGLAAATFVGSAGAVDIDWDNSSGDGNFNNPANWANDVLPTDPNDAVFVNPAAGPAIINADVPMPPRDIRFGSDNPNRPGSGTVNHTAGTLSLTSWLRMGIGGQGSGGTYNLSGTGVLETNRYHIGESASSVPSVINLSGNATLRQRDIPELPADPNADPPRPNPTPGPDRGDFWNIFGTAAGSTANFNISGGTASFFSRTLFGNGGGTANITQTGGVMEVRQGDITLGDTNGTVVYDISGGTMRTVGANRELQVGQWNGSNATLRVRGTGTVSASQNLIVGNGDPGAAANSVRGVVEQSGGTVTVANDLLVGNNASANGTYTQNSGDVTVGNALIVGNNASATAGATGLYTQNAGTTNAGRVIVGNNNGANGTFNLTGGTLRQPDVPPSNANPPVPGPERGEFWSHIGQATTGNFNISGGTASFDSRTHLGSATTGNGTVRQTGGTFEVRRHELIIGDTGTGTYNTSAGTLRTLSPNHDIVVGHWDNANGTLAVSGTGVVETARDLVVGNGNPENLAAGPTAGVVNQTGGTVRIANNLVLSRQSDATGTYNLGGGTLDLTGGTIDIGNGPGAFNFTGGNLINVAAVDFALVQSGGTFNPGTQAGPGATSVNAGVTAGGYTEAAGGTLQIDITAPSGTDVLTVTGQVTLAGMLDIVATGSLAANQSFLIINNDGADPVTGAFIGKLPGVPFTEDGTLWRISYTAGDGNDVALTVVPEPATAALAVLGAAGLMLRRRRSSR